MKKDSSEKMIDEGDYEIIESIAAKYNLSVESFGKLISKKNEDNRPTVRFTEQEMEIIDTRRAKFPMSRSEYCRRCFMKAIDDGSYRDIDIRAIKKDTYNKGTIARTKRAAMTVNNENDFKKMLELCDKLGLQLAALVRYFALNVEL